MSHCWTWLKTPPLGLESERMLWSTRYIHYRWSSNPPKVVRNKIILKRLATVIYSEARLENREFASLNCRRSEINPRKTG